MSEYRLSHLSDESLLRDLARVLTQERAATAILIAYLAEVDSRRLYVPAGYSSMFAYCVEELHFSEDSAYKRIRVARAARQFPALFSALAEGRLHLAAVALLAPHLTVENANELIDAGTHRSKADLEEWIATRFGSSSPERTPTAVIRPLAQLAPGRVLGAVGDLLAGATSQMFGSPLTPEPGTVSTPVLVSASNPEPGSSSNSEPGSPSTQAVAGFGLGEAGAGLGDRQLAPGRVETSPEAANRSPAAALLPEARYSVHLTLSKSVHDKLRHAQALLSHTVPSGDVVQVLERALDVLISKLETTKFGSVKSRADRSSNRETVPPGPAGNGAVHQHHSSRNAGASPPPTSTARRRYIPAQIRRAVWDRDEGRCTFVTHGGHRCSTRRFLEFDHVQPVARGGKTTVEGLRLRCRAHNQYSAEQTFGAEFMKRKREELRHGRRYEVAKGSLDSDGSPDTDRSVAIHGKPDKVREPSCTWITTRPGASSGARGAVKNYFKLARSGASFT